MKRSRRTVTALGLALAALAIGAIFGSFRTGTAAITVKPTNQNPPQINGTPQVGQTLTATNGTWSGTAPISFTYQWSRCDATGKNCKDISGENNNTYSVLQADVGSTLIVTVGGIERRRQGLAAVERDRGRPGRPRRRRPAARAEPV